MANMRRILLLLLFSILISNIFVGQSNTNGKTETNQEIKNLLKKLEETGESPERVDILLKLCKISSRFNREKAQDYAKQGIELSKKLKFQQGIADGFHFLGTILFLQDNYSRALYFYSKSLQIKEELGDKKGIAHSYNNIGLIYLNQGNYKQAKEYYLKSLQIKKELGDKKGIAHSSNNIGIVYYNQGNYSQALEYYLKSLQIKKELEDKKGIAQSYNNIGIIYCNQGNYSQAMEYHLKSLQTSKELGDKKAIANSYINIGNIYNLQDNYSQAMEYYSRSLKISEELGDQIRIASIYNNIGDIYLKQEEFSRALDFYKKGKDILEKIGNKPRLADSYRGLGECSSAIGDNKKAIDYLTRALHIGQAINSPDLVKKAAGKLSRVYAQLGQYEQAYQYHLLFKDKSDYLKNEANVKKITQLEMQYKFEKKQKQQELEQKRKDIQEKAELKHQRLIEYTFIGIAVLLAVVFYTLLRLMAKANRKLNKEIRERNQAEKRLRQSEAKFRALAEKSVVGICIIQDDAIQYANPTFLELFQYPQHQVIGTPLLDLVAPEDRPGVSRNFEKHRAGMQDTASFEFKGLTKNGDIIHLEAYGTLTHYQDKPALMETIINITDRKKTEVELLKTRKLETVGTISRGIAHDFNNLLAIILGNLELVKDSFNEPDLQLGSFVENAEQASTQAAELVSKFLTMSEGGWIMKKKLTLPAILKDTLASSPQIKGIPCTISFPGDIKPLYIDERQFRQVIVNLLLNAHEASSEMKEDKKIHISAQNMMLSTDNQWSLPEGEYVKVSVIDKGKGIPEDLLGKIFDPYFSTKRLGTRKGLGLGLPLCYAIIKKHAGHISVTSALHKGTTVDLILPVYQKNEI